MISTVLTCAKCAGTALQKNGSSRGKAKYRCYACGHQAVFAPAASERAARYAQVIRLLGERNSPRSIARVTGVARVTIAELIKKAATKISEKSKNQASVSAKRDVVPPGPEAILELDAMWTFGGRRKRKVWLWLAVERASRRIVSWVLGCRGAATARRLWQSLPARYQQHTTYFTDAWEAYAKVLPATAHRPSAKGSGQTGGGLRRGETIF